MVGLIVNVVLNVLLIPRLGPLGSAFATLATELAVIGVMAPICIWTVQWHMRFEVVIGVGVAIAVAEWIQSRPEFQTVAWPSSLVLLLGVWGLVIGLTLLVTRIRRGWRTSRRAKV